MSSLLATTPEEIGIDAFLDIYTEEHRNFWNEDEASTVHGPRPHFRASAIGKCLRSQILERAGVPKTKDLNDQAKRTFQLGDDIHWFVRRRWARMGLLIAEEVDITDAELSLSGHVDAIFGGAVQPIPEDWVEYRNARWVEFVTDLRSRITALTGGAVPVRGVEIKSIGQWSYKAFEGGVRYDHAMQAAAYAVLVDRHPDAVPESQVPEGWEVLYVIKDPLSYRRCGIGPSWRDQVLGVLEELNTAWSRGSIPDCTCGHTAEGMAWEAKYCSWPGPEGCCGQDESTKLLRLLERSMEEHS